MTWRQWLSKYSRTVSDSESLSKLALPQAITGEHFRSNPTRRDFLKLALAVPVVAATVDIEALLWTPKPIVVVQALPWTYGAINRSSFAFWRNRTDMLYSAGPINMERLLVLKTELTRELNRDLFKDGIGASMPSENGEGDDDYDY